jgi:hypothetical protein
MIIDKGLYAGNRFLLFVHGNSASLWQIISKIGLTNLYNWAEINVKEKMIDLHLKNIINWFYQLVGAFSRDQLVQ